jgi:hypothetical protein
VNHNYTRMDMKMRLYLIPHFPKVPHSVLLQILSIDRLCDYSNMSMHQYVANHENRSHDHMLEYIVIF